MVCAFEERNGEGPRTPRKRLLMRRQEGDKIEERSRLGSGMTTGPKSGYRVVVQWHA